LQPSVDATVIDFGAAVIDETLTRTIVLTNCGAQPAQFTFDSQSVVFTGLFISSYRCLIVHFIVHVTTLSISVRKQATIQNNTFNNKS